METNDPGGSLDDVAAARRAARDVANPWWLRLTTLIAAGALYSSMYGGPDTTSNTLWTTLFGVIVIAAVILIQKSRTKPAKAKLFSAPTLVIAVGAGASVAVAGALQKHLDLGTPSAYAIQFVVAVTLLSAMIVAHTLVLRRADRRQSPLSARPRS